MKGFEFEGYTCLYRSRDTLDARDEFLLKEGKVQGLVPVFLYKENLDWVFAYDLEGGYSLGEIYARGEKLIGVSWFLSFLKVVDFCVSEFFFNPEGFFVSMDTLLLDFDDLYKVRLIYCPLYKGDFWGSVLSLFGSIFREEVWFSDYLSGLERFGDSYSLGNFISFLKVFAEDSRGGSIPEELHIESEKPTKSIFDRGYLFLLDCLGKTSKISLVYIGLFVFLVGIIMGFLV